MFHSSNRAARAEDRPAFPPLLTVIVLLLLACLIGTAVLLVISTGEVVPGPDDPTDTSDTSDTSDTDNPPFEYVYHIDMSDYLAAVTAADLTLVNKENPCTADAENLVALTCATTKSEPIELNAVAARALYAMLAEMEADGITGVSVTSAYRSYTYQTTLFGIYLSNEMAAHPSWTREEAEAQVLTYSAAPGTSEHQSGLCVDLFASGMHELENFGAEGKYPDDLGFAETAAYPWLLENAYKFGFILRYPQGKEGQTGYSYESWHYRFVGREAATEIWQRGITLEEYLTRGVFS